MTTFVTGNLPTDMLSPEFFSFDTYFPSLEPDPVAITPGSIVLRDPLSFATIEVRGAFDVSSEQALLGSRVDEMIWRTGAGELLLDWNGLSILVAQAAGDADPEALFLSLLQQADQVTGGTGADVLRGWGGNDTISGNGGADTLYGEEGDDTLAGGPDSDRLEGGAGNDTAVFGGARGAYTVTKTGANFVVTHAGLGDGADTLVSVERAQFADMSVDLAVPARTAPPDYGADRALLFDPVFYLLDNPELVPTWTRETASEHYFAVGAAQGLRPNSWFDPAYYENKWADLKTLGLDDAVLFMHYSLYGVWEGRSAAPMFDTFDGNRYLAENPDVAAYVNANVEDFLGSTTNGAIAHFLLYGAAEQRIAHDLVGQTIDLGYAV